MAKLLAQKLLAQKLLAQKPKQIVLPRPCSHRFSPPKKRRAGKEVIA